MDSTATATELPGTERRKAVLWIAAALLPAVILGVGLAVKPEVFYDHFVWEDIWGPLLSDASQAGRLEHNGVVAKDGYTLTSEFTYGIILAALLYVIYKFVFIRNGVRADGWFVLSLSPFILLGPVARTLEDASVFCRAGTLQSPSGPCDPGFASFFFISPVIYMQEAVWVLLFIALGLFIRSRATTADPKLLTALVGAGGLTLASGYAFVVTAFPEAFMVFAKPWIVYAAALIGTGVFAARAFKGQAGVNATAFALGFPFIVPALWLIGVWLSGGEWIDDPDGALYPDAAGVMLAFATGITAVIALLAFLLERAPGKRVSAIGAVYIGGFNLALVFGHMLDAFATWVALEDPFALGLPSYSEKHPVSDFLLGFADGLGFPIAKLVMILGVIWLLDREFKEDRPEDHVLLGLIKMAIFILGFAPGLRDLLRVSMGI